MFASRVGVLVGLALPGVARADALDAVGVIAGAVFAVWALFALPVLGFACFGQVENSGGRMFTSGLLCLTWAPAILFAFGAESPLVGLVLGGLVVGGLVRTWRNTG